MKLDLNFPPTILPMCSGHSHLNIYLHEVKSPIFFSQKDLDALLEKDKTHEEESKNLTEMLAKQKEKYELLQVKGHFGEHDKYCLITIYSIPFHASIHKSYDTRSQLSYHLSIPCTNNMEGMFFYSAVKLWNNVSG